MAWKWRGGQWNIGEKYHGEMMSMYRYCCGSVVGYNVPHRLQKTGKQDWQQKRDKVWSDNNNALYCNGWTKNAWYNTHALMHDLIRGDAFITNRQVLLRNNRRTEYSWYMFWSRGSKSMCSSIDQNCKVAKNTWYCNFPKNKLWVFPPTEQIYMIHDFLILSIPAFCRVMHFLSAI
jgi:hypothetical protein